MKIELDDTLADKLRMMHRWLSKVKVMHQSDEPNAAFYGNVLKEVVSQYDAQFKAFYDGHPQPKTERHTCANGALCPTPPACKRHGCGDTL